MFWCILAIQMHPHTDIGFQAPGPLTVYISLECLYRERESERDSAELLWKQNGKANKLE